MRVVLLASPPALAVRHHCPPAPELLDLALASVLATRADLEVEHLRLPEPSEPTPVGRLSSRSAAIREARGAARILADTVEADVVYALDLLAGAAALAARDLVVSQGRRVSWRVVVRTRLTGLALADNPVWTAVVRAADRVVVITARDRAAVRRRGVPSERIASSDDAALVAENLLRAEGAAVRPAPLTGAGHAASYLLLLADPGASSLSDCLIRALRRQPDMRLVCSPVLPEAAPDGWASFRALGGQAGVTDRIEHRPVVRSDLAALVDGARAVVAVGPEHAGGEEALLAMMRARAVLGFDTGDTGESVVDGITGRLVAPGHADELVDALSEAWADDYTVTAWGQAGLDRVRSRFAPDAVAAGTLSAVTGTVLDLAAVAPGDGAAPSDPDGSEDDEPPSLEGDRLSVRSKETAGDEPPDRRTAEELVRDHLWLARSIAAQYGSRREPREDLFQVACLGLMKAVRGFRPELGHRFAAYAGATIDGELKRHFRDRPWAVRPPRRLQELRDVIRRERAALEQQLGRAVTGEDLRARTGLTDEEFRAVRTADGAYDGVPLDPTGHDDPDRGGLIDVLSGGDASEDEVVVRLALGRALRTLPERDQRIVAMRFSGGMTQQEIAEEIGVTQMQVSRLLRQALTRLRASLDGDLDDDGAARATRTPA